MLYRNEKTGVIIDVENSVLGGDWKPVEKKTAEPKKGKKK